MADEVDNEPPEAGEAAGKKNKIRKGQNACWACGAQVAALECVPAESVPDVKCWLQWRTGKSADELSFPKHHNRLCPTCRPPLPPQHIVNAEVAIEVPDKRGLPTFARGTVSGPAGPPAEGENFFDAARRWKVQWSGTNIDADTTLTTDDVQKAARTRSALNRSERAALQRERDERLRDERQAELRAEQNTDESQRRAARMPASPPAPAPQPPPAPPTVELIRTRRDVRLKLPSDAAPGKVVRVTLPEGFLRGSPEQACEFHAPAGSAPGELWTVQLWVMAPAARVPQPPDQPRDGAAPPRRGKKLGPGTSKDLRAETREIAEAAGLEYVEQPNKLNPVTAWPIRVCLSFANLTPAYFGLPGRGRLFKNMFGFGTFELAMAFMRAAFEAEHDGTSRAVLHPRFQYLAALWRMRANESPALLAAFFGIAERTMSNYLNEWIPRLGMFAKTYLVFLPKMETITALMPKSFIDCKMEKVVLIGDCKDHRVESIRNSIVASADQHSSKSDASVAMGQQWCTPTGLVGAACDLVCSSCPLPPHRLRL